MYQCDEKTRQAICDVVSEFYHEVEADYVDTVPDEDHIYYALRHLQTWLENNAPRSSSKILDDLVTSMEEGIKVVQKNIRDDLT